jgi:hypothetical protein
MQTNKDKNYRIYNQYRRGNRYVDITVGNLNVMLIEVILFLFCFICVQANQPKAIVTCTYQAAHGYYYDLSALRNSDGKVFASIKLHLVVRSPD